MCQTTPCACGASNGAAAIPPSSPTSVSTHDSATVVLMPSNTQQPKDHQTGCGYANSNGVEDIEQGPQNVDIRLLKTLSSHLDLLYAGSLFLLPSILPYVASALVSYSNASSSHETTAEAASHLGWGLAWAMFLTCVGVILPLAAFKIMISLESDCLSSKNANMPRRSWIMATVSAIKRTWMSLKENSPGYGPLALDASNSSRLYDESEDDDENVSYKNIHRPSALPRPKTIIMTSLAIWTLLMVLSDRLGLNTVTRPESTLVTPETTRVWEAQSWSNVHVGGFVEHEVQPKNSVSAMKPVLDADMEQAREKSPFATIQADVVVLDKGAQEEVDVSEQDVEDFMDPDALEAMTLDPEDASVLKSFLNHLQADDEALKAMEKGDRVVAGNLPCGYEKPLLPNVARKLFGKASDIAQTYTAPHEQGQVFDYIAGWTELMIFLIAMCLGTLVVGLAQARALHFQLLEQHMMRPRRRISLAILAGCLVIAGSALGLTMVMIFAESWDLPSVQFVGIGIAGMILVHAWIPSLPLYVESGEVVYMSESESEEDDDENEEKTPVRRNACSLDERRRCELTSYRV
ncbi:MAG: hypothetical protein J3Q66DRAFT_354503 [Benniella sp.]|nr:MAG: hypothetical protein J3Q66DRAFT_354503 [Benniella sp.]